MTPEEALLALRAVATLRTALLGLAIYAFARLTVYVWRPLLDRVFVSTSVVRFVPYDSSAVGSDTVCVDCTHRTLPTLTHHKDGSTPVHLRGDTSTDTVFNALRAGFLPEQGNTVFGKQVAWKIVFFASMASRAKAKIPRSQGESHSP